VQLGLAKAPAKVTSARHAPLASWLEPVAPTEVPVTLACVLHLNFFDFSEGFDLMALIDLWGGLSGW
jgi:hypothetical protein